MAFSSIRLEPGMTAHVEIISRLTPEKALVRMAGRELVLQFGTTITAGSEVDIQITSVTGKAVFARMIPEKHTIDDIISSLRLEQGYDRNTLERVIHKLQALGLPLTMTGIRKIITLTQTLDNDLDLAMALYLKIPGLIGTEIELKDIISLLGRLKGKNPAELMQQLEKYLIDSPQTAENQLKTRELFSDLSFDGLIRGFKDFIRSFSPDLEAELLQGSGDLLSRFRFRLLELKKRLSRAGQECPELDDLIAVTTGDSLRSVILDGSTVLFYTLFWKNRDGSWQTADLVIQTADAANMVVITVRSEFSRMGAIGAVLRYDRTARTLSVNICSDTDTVRRFLAGRLEQMTGIRAAWSFTSLEELDSLSLTESIKKIDLVV
jgi:hypothetical protein